jgi:hypothetical protein
VVGDAVKSGNAANGPLYDILLSSSVIDSCQVRYIPGHEYRIGVFMPTVPLGINIMDIQLVNNKVVTTTPASPTITGGLGYTWFHGSFIYSPTNSVQTVDYDFFSGLSFLFNANTGGLNQSSCSVNLNFGYENFGFTLGYQFFNGYWQFIPPVTTWEFGVSYSLNQINALPISAGITGIGPDFIRGEANAIYVFNGVVYASGSDGNENACYWIVTNEAATNMTVTNKNEKKLGKGWVNAISYTNGIVYSAGDDGTNCFLGLNTKTNELGAGWANAIYVDNGIAYVAGDDSFGNAYCYEYEGTNIKTIILGKGRVNSIFVDKGNVYAAGRDADESACYWTVIISNVKNIAETNINEIKLEKGWGNYIYVYEDTVYMAGRDDKTTNACYWKLKGAYKTYTNLNSNLGPGRANAIFADKGHIYIGGVDGRGNACYWIDGAETYLGQGWVSSIFIYNNTVFAAGDDDTNACFWTGNNGNTKAFKTVLLN